MSLFLLDMYQGMELLDHNFIYSFLRDYQTFLNGYTILHSHQQCVKVPVFPIVLSTFVIICLSALAIIVGVKYLIVVIFDSYFSDDVESGLFLKTHMLGEEKAMNASKPEVGYVEGYYGSHVNLFPIIYYDS